MSTVKIVAPSPPNAMAKKVKDKRFVIWAKCTCKSAFNVFRGGPQYSIVQHCNVKLPALLSKDLPTPWCTVDAVVYNQSTSKVAAMILNPLSVADKRTRLEAMVGWRCPVVCLPPAIWNTPHFRYQSVPTRMCQPCVMRAWHEHRWKSARRAFHRWKSNCRFVYQ